MPRQKLSFPDFVDSFEVVIQSEISRGCYIDIIDTTPDCTPIIGEGRGERLFVGALRAYLIVSWGDPINPGGERSPKEKLEIVLKDYGTGIRSIDNGQLIIDNYGEVWYDLSGRKLSGKPARGIYIEGGKKILP